MGNILTTNTCKRFSPCPQTLYPAEENFSTIVFRNGHEKILIK